MNVRTGFCRLLSCAALYTLYLCFGALVFMAIEETFDYLEKEKLMKIKQQFLQDNSCIKESDLESLLKQITKGQTNDFLLLKNGTKDTNWDFAHSLFFSGTLVTTIGYGRVTPLSREGKLFCIIYALLGIPFTLVLLTAVVERLLVPTVWLLQFLNSKLGHLYQPFHIRLIHLFLLVLVLLTFFLLIPAAFFAAIEPEWNYLDAFYYCFISMTTIGLGDYIPGDSPEQKYRPIYKMCVLGYLFFAVTFMMLTLTVFYDIPQLNLGQLFTQSEEQMHLAGNGFGLNYGVQPGFRQAPLEDNTHRQVVRVRSRHNDESPSPEEQP